MNKALNFSTLLSSLQPIVIFLLIAAGVAWYLTVLQSQIMGNMVGTMGMTLASFVFMWTLMMAAMMLPSITPLATRYNKIIRSYKLIGSLSFAAMIVLTIVIAVEKQTVKEKLLPILSEFRMITFNGRSQAVVDMFPSSLIHQMIEHSLQSLSLLTNNTIKTDPKYHHSYIYCLALLRYLLETRPQLLFRLSAIK